MDEKLISLSDKITGEEIIKVSFEEFIKQKVLNEKDKNTSITKEELKKEISLKVKDDLNEELSSKIDSIFNGQDSILIKDIKLFEQQEEHPEIEQKQEEVSNKENEQNSNKVNPSDLDLLSQELPKEITKKEEPFSEELLKNNDTLNLLPDLEVPQKENEYNSTFQVESIVKPSNTFSQLGSQQEKDKKKEEKVSNDNNNCSLKDSTKEFFNHNVPSSKSNNRYSGEDNLVYPINQKKGMSFLSDTQNQPVEQHKTNKENIYVRSDDYFFDIIKNVSNSKKIEILNDKLYKISSMNQNSQATNLFRSSYTSQKSKNNELYSYRFNSQIRTNNNQNIIKEKIEREMKLMIDGQNRKSPSKPKTNADKQKILEKLKNDLSKFPERKKESIEKREKNENELNELNEKINKMLNNMHIEKEEKTPSEEEVKMNDEKKAE